MSARPRLAVVGTGPAGLMAATQAISHSEVTLFDRRPGAGRKLLIAGSSGLNITHGGPLEDFVPHYQGADAQYWSGLFREHGPADWISFIEKELGLETFIGTSERAFVREMKASGLLKRWLSWLEARGAQVRTSHELQDFSESPHGVELWFSTEITERFDSAVFALGGGSWENSPPIWPEIFRGKGFAIEPFEPSNVGFEVDWSKGFLAESEGKPLKSIALETARGSKRGELVITRTGIEGTPLYFLGMPGEAWLDLKPDLAESEVFARLQSVRENLSPLRRAKKQLGLSEAAQSLLFHHGSPQSHNDLSALAHTIKRFPIKLLRPRPLEEAISSSGGLALSELDLSTHLLKRMPRIACAGEMLAWDAPTGGYLIQACISQGARAGKALKLAP